MKLFLRFRRHIPKWSRFILLFVLLLSGTEGGHTQSRKDLEKQRREKEKEIEETRKLINQTTEKQKQTTQYLTLLTTQIHNREELIGTLNVELRVIGNSIDDNSDVADA